MATLLIIAPLLAVLALNLSWKAPVNRLAVPGALALCLCQAALVFMPDARFWTDAAAWPGSLLLFQPNIDSTARVMLLAIGIVSAAALCVCRFEFAGEANSRFMAANLMLLALAGMNGIVLTGDLFTLYIFLEVTAVASFVLIAFDKRSDALEGAFKYLALSAAASAMILAAVALLMLAAGDMSFAAIAHAVGSAPDSGVIKAAVALLTAGLLIKGGLIPFHGWLPDAYSAAPPSVSVLLAGIVTKTTGVYTLMRLADSVFGGCHGQQAFLLTVGTASALLGALAALGQSDIKRMLAYSSISQTGFIVLGLGAGTQLGMAGAVLHLLNHAIFKTLLFVNAAAVEKRAGTRDMTRMGGLAHLLPGAAWTSVIASLSTAGIPPLAGFWSKLIIIVALWQAGLYYYAVLAVVSSLLTLAYFLPMLSRVFFAKPFADRPMPRGENRWLWMPAVVLAVIIVALGCATPWLFETFLLPVGSFL